MTTAERQLLLNATLSAAKTRNEFMRAISEVVLSFKLSNVTVMAVPTAGDVTLGPHILETTLPIRFLREFDRQQHLRHCPLISLLKTSMLPRRWCLDDLDGAYDRDLPAGLIKLLRRFGLLMGALFPVTSIDGMRFALWFDGTRERLCLTEMNELVMISIHAFEVYDGIRRQDSFSPGLLSARELEVVRWTAQGKTSVEIGRILSLSDHTINTYLTKAIKKLDCVNRTQLVAKALRLRLIA